MAHKRTQKNPEPQLMTITENVRANARKVARELAEKAERELDVVLDRVGLIRKSKKAA